MAEPTSGYGEMPMQTEAQYRADERTRHAEWVADLRVQLKAKFNVPDGFEDLAVDIWLDGKND